MKVKSLFSFPTLYGLLLLLSTSSSASFQSEVLQDMRNPEQRLVLSSQNRLSQEVLKECQTLLLCFGVPSQEANALQEHLKAADRKESIAISDPTALASGLWQVCQETKRQTRARQIPLSPDILISCNLRAKLSLLRTSWEQVIRVFPLIKFKPNLTQLELFRCEVTDQNVDSLMSLFYLRELSLEENYLTDQGAIKLSTHPRIVSLKLWKNNIGPEGAKALSRNNVLRELGLYKNHVGDEGAQYLSQSTTLTHLDLRENNISDIGAKALADNRSFTSLRLRYNKITDEGAEPFLFNSHIVDLDIKRNQISEPELVNFLESPHKDSLDYFQKINL